MRSRASIFFTVVLAITLLDGVAPVLAASHDTPVASAPGDPWERQSRRDYAIEGALDRHVIGPVARFYHKVTPGPIGRGIQNVLSEPVVIINRQISTRSLSADPWTWIVRITSRI